MPSQRLKVAFEKSVRRHIIGSSHRYELTWDTKGLPHLTHDDVVVTEQIRDEFHVFMDGYYAHRDRHESR